MSRVGEAARLGLYPGAPGYKESTTSKQAAQGIASKADVLRERVFNVIDHAVHGITADAIAPLLHEIPGNIRPRVSELRATGRVFDSGRRGPSSNGRSSIVWTTIQPKAHR